jgi:hypothetical protein
MEHQQDQPSLWITDAELIRRLGAPEKVARETIRHLDRQSGSGFPKKVALWGNRRYWPAVKAFLDKKYGLSPQDERKRA